MHSPTIEKLIKLFAKFPTVGPRTAGRFVFYLVKTPPEEIEEILQGIKDLKSKIKICSFCFNTFESETPSNDLCPICSDPRRDKTVVCVVEKETDLETIEKTNQYKGLYFILGGMITNLKKEKEKQKTEERVAQLIERLKKEPAFAPNGAATGEIILALNPTTEGQNTTLWLKRKLEPLAVKITQLGRGLPIGGELEYADEETLSSALENRR